MIDEVSSHDMAARSHHTHGGWTLAPVSPVPQTGKQLRSSLLNKLGIIEPMALSPNRELPRAYPLNRAKILYEPLKDPPSRLLEGDETSEASGDKLFVALASIFAANHQLKRTEHRNAPSSTNLPELPNLDSCSEASSCATAEKQVTFNEVVTVVPIPRRDQYSDRMRKHIWESSEIVQANIVRNSLEFAADGYDPQTVREEDEHILCPTTGNLIHPIHFELAKILREKRGLPEAANVEALLRTLQY